MPKIDPIDASAECVNELRAIHELYGTPHFLMAIGVMIADLGAQQIEEDEEET